MNHLFKLALASALCAFPTIAQACSCAPPPAPKIALKNSAAVFVGRVTSVERSEFSNKFQFAVSKQWKGAGGKSVSIVTATSSAACGINFDSDRDYLVYAFKTEGDEQLRTNLCTRTKRAADADADLAELGAPLNQTSASKYVVSRDGVVQLDVGKNSNPFTILSQAIPFNETAQLFRLNWMGPNGYSSSGTSLYNRASGTLKSYSRLETASQVNVISVLYSGLTNDVLQKLAATKEKNSFFLNYAKYGVTKKDLGTRIVQISS